MRRVWQDTNDACLRACVAMVMDRDYREIPYIPPTPDNTDREIQQFWSAWINWVFQQGWWWESLNDPSPVDYPEGPWIAIVPSLNGRSVARLHAVVMVGQRLFHDPSPANPRKRNPRKVEALIELYPYYA